MKLESKLYVTREARHVHGLEDWTKWRQQMQDSPQVNLHNIPEEFLAVGGWLFWFFYFYFCFYR